MILFFHGEGMESHT